MLRFSNTLVRQYGAKLVAVSRSSSHLHCPTLHRSSSSPVSQEWQTISTVNAKSVYRTSVAAFQAAWRSLVPGTARSLQISSSQTSKGVIGSRSRSLASSSLKKYGYRTYTSQNWDEAMKRPRRSVLSMIWGATGSLLKVSTLVLNAFSIFHIHSALHQDNPTWVSYLSFVPLLDWIPMLDIARLDRLWILFPATIVGTLALVSRLPARGPILALLFLPLGLFELYRNYKILEHFEQRNWTSLLLWSFFRLEWLFMTSLAIIGTENYQLVPHQQATITETANLVLDRLDQSLEDQEVVPSGNVPFIVLTTIWQTFPFMTELRPTLAKVYSATGLESASNYVSNLFSSKSLPDAQPAPLEPIPSGQPHEDKGEQS